MKFSDIDFSALSRMLDSMSDSEKEQVNRMAEQMMGNFPSQETSEEEQDFYTYLNIDEEKYSKLPGEVLEALESAADLEEYYEEVDQADHSAAIVFYAKALLRMIRYYAYPYFQEAIPEFCKKEQTTLMDYFGPMCDQDTFDRLEAVCKHSLHQQKQVLMQMLAVWNQAQYDVVSDMQLQIIKQALLEQEGLLCWVE